MMGLGVHVGEWSALPCGNAARPPRGRNRTIPLKGSSNLEAAAGFLDEVVGLSGKPNSGDASPDTGARLGSPGHISGRWGGRTGPPPTPARSVRPACGVHKTIQGFLAAPGATIQRGRAAPRQLRANNLSDCSCVDVSPQILCCGFCIGLGPCCYNRSIMFQRPRFCPVSHEPRVHVESYLER
jgi:hypothetical protein